MTRKSKALILISGLFILILLILFWVLSFLSKEGFNQVKLSEPVIPQEGIYEVSNYGFWTRARATDVVFKLNSNIMYKAHEDSIFQKYANAQASGGIDSIVHNGSNTLEVYFKDLPVTLWREKLQELIARTGKEASAHIIRNDNVYKDGKPYTATEVTEVQIDFKLDEHGKPVITTPESTVTEKELKIEHFEDGYTKVTANFILNDARHKAWENGERYNESEHRALLNDAYVDFWNILSQQNWRELKGFYAIALTEARAQEPMISEEMVYSMISPEAGIKEAGLRLLPMDPIDGYEVEINDNGKLFRLVKYNKEGTAYSPIVFQSKPGDPNVGMSINPWFSVIDGKVVLTLPF